MNKKFNFSGLHKTSKENVTKKLRSNLNKFEKYLNTYQLKFSRIQIVPLDPSNSSKYKLEINSKIEESEKDAVCSKLINDWRLSFRTYANMVKVMKTLGCKMAPVNKTTTYQQKKINFTKFIKMKRVLTLNAEKKFGYKRQAIFKYIAFEDSVPDHLHMVLRITDQLFDGLISHINLLDNNNSADYNKRPLLKGLKHFFEVDCNIAFPFYTKEEDNIKSKIKLRSLNKNARIKILKELGENRDLSKIFPGFETYSIFVTLNFLMKEYNDLYKLISIDFSNIDFNENIALMRNLKIGSILI